MESSREYEVKQCGFTVSCMKHLSKYTNEKESTLKLIFLLEFIFKFTSYKEDVLSIYFHMTLIFNEQIKHRRN